MPRRRRSSPYRHHSHHHHHQSGEHGSDGDQNPPQRNAANARERARMRVLSRAFCRLKTTLPWVPADTKLSKLDTLRLATSYIAHLRAALAADQPVDIINGTITNMAHHPLNLSWPFTFQHGVNHNGSCRVAAPPSPQGGGADSDCSSSSPISDLGPLCAESNIGHPDFSPFMYHDDGYINHNHDTWQCR